MKVFKYLLGSALGFYLLIGFMAIEGCKKHSDSEFENRLNVGLNSKPKTLDPRLATDVASARIQQLIYNSLVKKNLESQLIPDLAEKWTMLDDQTYRFNLRKHVKFHNGKHLTAQDVKATFTAIRDERLASPRKAAYSKLESITVEDDYTIVFRTTDPFAPFLINMVQGILPEEEASKINLEQSIEPIGTGPYKLISQTGDERFHLEAFKECFSGVPEIDAIDIVVVPDDTIRLMELENGDLHFLQNNVPLDSLKRLGDNPNIQILSQPGTSYYYCGFNLRLNYPAADKTVRHALAMAVNRDEIIEHVLAGRASKAQSVFPESHWVYNENLDTVEYDPVKAEQLLDQAGYPKKNDGTRFKIEFKCSQNKQSQRLVQIVQAQWAKIGVHVTIRSLEWGTFYQDIIDGNFETYILSWVGVTDPDIYYSLFHSESCPPNGRNRGYYQNEILDQLLEKGRKTLNRDARKQIYDEVQMILADELPYINLWHNHNIAVMNTNLRGYKLYPAGDFEAFDEIYWNNLKKEARN